MMKHIFLISLTLFVCSSTFAQVPMATQIQILKAEDARRYDKTLEDLLKSPNEQVRIRAALAAGRIGNDAAIPTLLPLLEKGTAKEREMAAFALGEIESVKASDAILKALGTSSPPIASGPPKLSESSRVATRVAGNGNGMAGGSNATLPDGRVSARLLEAAGKIAAANANDPKSKELGAAIVKVLADEETKRTEPNTDVIRLGLTAVLRARPAGAEETLRKFLAFTDPNIVADALNALARLRAKNANRDARDLLSTHTHAIVRANAARVLGAADDKEGVDVLIKAATTDTDSRVRVSSIRALGALKDAKAADPLLGHGEKLLAAYTKAFKPGYQPAEHSEFLEVAVALGLILPYAENERAEKMLSELGKIDKGHSPEIYVARVRIGKFSESSKPPEFTNWRQFRSFALIVGEFAALEPRSEAGKQLKAAAPELIRPLAKLYATVDPDKENTLAAPDVLRAFARFKTEDLGAILRDALKSKEIFVRATAAELISELPPSQENILALRSAFEYASANDVSYNDAILAMVDALIKLDRVGSMETWAKALISPDHLVRRRVRDEVPEEIRKITDKELLYEVNKPVGPGTRMGQVLNTDADYRRALLRKNGSVKAVLTTEKGTFTIDLLPEDAPLTVDNFIKLANAKYFNGVEVHRVVPNFVMQDGDPRGDGNGGPGWTIRCEVNMVPYERGAVGMALSGKDTGGSQWFVTHSPQPHLDGGYTVFGKVNETGMRVVDNIVRGDKIVSVRIIGK